MTPSKQRSLAEKLSAEAQAKVKRENEGCLPVAMHPGFRERMEQALAGPTFALPNGLSQEEIRLFILSKATGETP